MLQKIAINIILSWLANVIGPISMEYLKQTIMTLNNKKIPGEEKKRMLLESARALGGDISSALRLAPSWAINAAIEMIVMRGKLDKQ